MLASELTPACVGLEISFPNSRNPGHYFRGKLEGVTPIPLIGRVTVAIRDREGWKVTQQLSPDTPVTIHKPVAL